MPRARLALLGSFAALIGACKTGHLAAGPVLSPPEATAPAAQLLPTGAMLTPYAAPGSTYEELDPGLAGIPGLRASQPAALAVSPDGGLLATLTSGYNRMNGPKGSRLREASTEWLFLHAIGDGPPRQVQALPVPNAFKGLAWAPDGSRLFASGGVDDVVHEYREGAAGFAEVQPPVPLGHASGLGLDVKPLAAGLAVDPAGGRLVVTNYENDSITVVDLARRAAVAELDLRPGKLDPRERGKRGGAYPVAVAFSAPGVAWVACARDREVVQVDLRGERPQVAARVPVGEQPVALLAAGARVWVANSGDDTVFAIDPASARVTLRLPVLAADASRGLRGTNPDALAMTPDGHTLLVALGGLNAVAALPIGGGRSSLFPTGWYPDGLAFGARAGRVLVAIARDPSGPNPGACLDRAAARKPGAMDKAEVTPHTCRATNQYVWQLVKGGLASFPLPGPDEAARLTAQALANARLGARDDDAELFAFLRTRVKHVIYVVKENRTYDQVLGDLAGADGDPRLVVFPEALTPNHHTLARGFVTLDRFFVSGQVSGDGWNWSTAGRTSHVTEQLVSVLYGGRGGSYDFQGMNRNVNVSLPLAQRQVDDDDLLPGPADVAQPGGESGSGYLWDAAVRAGLEIRNYGFFGDDSLYDKHSRHYLPPARHAFAEKRLQFVATKTELNARSDPYFRAFDQRVPDLWNLEEWERELAGYEARGSLPALSFVSLDHDHFGDFGEALAGVDTPDTQMADNDYALGRLVERLATSPFARDTVVIALEDDAQDGPDHVDSHRSVLLVAGAHVRQGVRSSRPATTVDVLRTIEELLGLEPLGITDGNARPLGELFDRDERPWTYTAIVPEVLRSTKLELPPRLGSVPAAPVLPRGNAAGWARATRGFDFSTADAVDSAAFNRVLAEGLAPR